VTLNIDDALNTPRVRKRATSLRATRRAILEQAVVDEMTSWNPLEFLGTFKSMHKGSLSLVHLNVLLELATHGPMAMGRLAEGLEVSVASATGIVDRMEKNGFVKRRHDDEDRRVVVVHPTDAAANVFSSLQQRRRDGLGKLIDSLSDRQLVGLVSGHRALRRARARLPAQSIEGGSERPGL
jgi:MarR family transcriptional regulator, organic hydroperoxide resistance regulator